jgi:hypothetical protein
MQGDNFRAVSPETAAWVLAQHFSRMSIRKRLDMRGRHRKPPMSEEGRQHMRQIQLKAFCERVGITEEERLAYKALIRSHGLKAAEALEVIKGARKA